MATRTISNTFRVEDGVTKLRVDSWASTVADLALSRSQISMCEITVNGAAAKNSTKVTAGDTVTISRTIETLDGIEGEDIPLSVIYEDEDVLVIDKPQGMVVHPAVGNTHGTLVNALVWRYGQDFIPAADEDDDDQSIALLSRPGIVHRLDKDTSGVMIVAKNARALTFLAEQFANHSTVKYYRAIVKGFFTSRRGRIETNIARSGSDRKKFAAVPEGKGKSAKTEYLVEEQFDSHALLRIRIHTGRTHQIRVHMSSENHPVVGDPIYSRKDSMFPDATLMLHSSHLEITLPSGEQGVFDSALPERFVKMLDELRTGKTGRR